MTAPEVDRVLQVYDVENLHAAVVEAYIDWRKALVEAVIRAELSGAATTRLLGHELCVRRLASLLQLASSYREGREWTCECNYCRFMNGIRNYLAHHWTRGGASFAISGGRWRRGSVWTERHDPDADDDRVDVHTYGPHVDIDLVSRSLKERRKFDAAARALGKGARRFNLAPAVDGHLRCLSASYADWRKKNPLPKRGGPHAGLLEIARRRRQASAGRQLGTLGLVGGAWEVNAATGDFLRSAAAPGSRRRAGRDAAAGVAAGQRQPPAEGPADE